MIETATIVGPTNSRWGQTYAKGAVSLVIELDDESGQKLGREIIQDLCKRLDAIEVITLENLKKLVSDANLPLSASIIIAAKKQKTLYIVGVGKGKVFLRRDAVWATVFEGEGGVSGPVKESDRLFLCSPSFLACTSEKTLQAVSGTTSLDELEDMLASKIHEREDNEGAAALVLQISKKEIFSSRMGLKGNTKTKGEMISSTFRRAADNFLSKRRAVSVEKGRRLNLSIGILLLFLLIISLVFGSTHRRNRLQHQAYEEISTASQQKLEEAEILIDTQPVKARESLSEVKKTLEETLLTFKEGSDEYEKTALLLATANELLTKAERKFTIEEAELFYNLSWIKEGARGDDLSLFEDHLSILDRKNNSVYSLILSKKQSSIAVSDEKLSSASQVANYDKDTYILLKNGDKTRIYNQLLNEVVPEEEAVGNLVDMVSFASNLYLLDRDNGIWKYPGVKGGFGSKQSYLSKDASVNFSESVSMSIDGNIWVLTGTDILKFAGGTPQAFFIQDESLINPKAFYTNEFIDYLYILENERVVVLDKKGNYREQYLWSGLSGAKDIVVSKDLGKIIILKDGKLYEIDLAR